MKTIPKKFTFKNSVKIHLISIPFLQQQKYKIDFDVTYSCFFRQFYRIIKNFGISQFRLLKVPIKLKILAGTTLDVDNFKLI